MDAQEYTFNNSSKPCPKWATGECPGSCGLDHHSNLDPSTRDKTGFEFPKTQSCRRCCEKALQCDKVGRPDANDPCSECRHFAGRKAECVLHTKPMNDAQWATMMTRSREGYNLPPYKDRDEVKYKKKQAVFPEPMENVKADWEGETADQLRKKGDFLNADIRAHPRKYLDPPGMTHKQQQSSGKHDKLLTSLGVDEYTKRRKAGTLFDKQPSNKRALETPTLVSRVSRSPGFALFPSPLENRPSIPGTSGILLAETMVWSFVDQKWQTTTWCEESLGPHLPSKPTETVTFRPTLPPFGDAILATWSFVTRKWKITFEDDFSMESSPYEQSEERTPVVTGQPQVSYSMISSFAIVMI